MVGPLKGHLCCQHYKIPTVRAIPEYLKATLSESWGAKMDGQSFTGYNGEQRNYSAEPNNIKDFFRTGLSANNSIRISSGSEKMQTYLSYATILYRYHAQK
ncbi:MAG: hypothetical protein IPI77_23575 [Saprospiraceae bacterium]|nr:hypothetical protein [Saprospiraceae bacterium]